MMQEHYTGKPKKEQHLRQAEEATAWPGHCVARVGENKHVEAFLQYFFHLHFCGLQSIIQGDKIIYFNLIIYVK